MLGQNQKGGNAVATMQGSHFAQHTVALLRAGPKAKNVSVQSLVETFLAVKEQSGWQLADVPNALS
jgi:hypothetical protein